MPWLSRNKDGKLDFFCALGYPVRGSNYHVMNGPHYVDSDCGPYILIFTDGETRFVRFNLG